MMSSGPQMYGQQTSADAEEPAKGKDGKEKLLHKGPVRAAAGERWRDPTLDEWPENDFRVFVGDLGNEVNDEHLSKAFGKYASFAKAKVGDLNQGLGSLFSDCPEGGETGKIVDEKIGTRWHHV